MEYTGYLFVHFIGEEKDGEQIYFSLSRDGLHWEDLNAGKPVLYSRIGEAGARDPFLIRSPWQEEGKPKYFLIATDLRIEAGKGWQSAQYAGSRDILVWESENLTQWKGPRAHTIGVEMCIRDRLIRVGEVVTAKSTSPFFRALTACGVVWLDILCLLYTSRCV